MNTLNRTTLIALAASIVVGALEFMNIEVTPEFATEIVTVAVQVLAFVCVFLSSKKK